MLKLNRYSDALICVVDDEPSTLSFLQALLAEAGFVSVATARNSSDAVKLIQTGCPDLLLVDWHLGSEDSAEVIRQLRVTYPDEIIPVIVLTADLSPEAKHQALAAGASDFLNKPFDLSEVLLRLQNHLEIRRMHRMRARELELARLEILERLARAAEYRDDATGEHIVRVGRLSEQLGRILGLDEESLFRLRHAAPLHDVGKIGIPDAILRKPGALSAMEWEIMRQHTVIGARILEDCPYPVVQMAHQIALTHHERWDGRGYPQGLQAEQIPLWGRIVAVADAYDAMTSNRPYRDALRPEQALEIIRAERERQFDPLVVDAFLDPAMFTQLGEETDSFAT
ncbi:MAG: response regulator [Fimbriimonadales bacterium]|nr:response regulator [Fimbriimonadales bacterium]